MKGKEKCKILKEIRAEIAKANDINWVTENCTHKGDCRGTCPKCESEVRALEHELERRRMLGKTVVLAGISASMIISTMGCDEILYEEFSSVDGDMAIENTTTTVPEYDGGMVPEPGEAVMEVFLEDFSFINETGYVANDLVYASLLGKELNFEDTGCPVNTGDSFTAIGYAELWNAYLVRLENGTLCALPADYIEKITPAIPPVKNHDGYYYYGNEAYFIGDFFFVSESEYAALHSIDLYKISDLPYSNPTVSIETDQKFTIIGNSSKYQSPCFLIRLEDSAIYAAKCSDVVEHAELVEETVNQ